MSCTAILKARVSPELKLQAKVVADRELLTEAAWLKRLSKGLPILCEHKSVLLEK